MNLVRHALHNRGHYLPWTNIRRSSVHSPSRGVQSRLPIKLQLSLWLLEVFWCIFLILCKGMQRGETSNKVCLEVWSPMRGFLFARKESESYIFSDACPEELWQLEFHLTKVSISRGHGEAILRCVLEHNMWYNVHNVIDDIRWPFNLCKTWQDCKIIIYKVSFV